MTNSLILIMDDEQDLRNLYAKVLVKAGYEVYTAATVQMARDLLHLHHFDVFLCDIQMGHGELGFTLLRQEIDKLNADNTQIVMMSCEVQYRPLCEEMGIEFFLEKPVAIHPLITLVSRLTTRHAT